jgi:hypothetical protein
MSSGTDSCSTDTCTIAFVLLLQAQQVHDGLEELGDGAGQTAAQRLQCMQRTLKTYTDTVKDAAGVSDTPEQ